MLGLLFFTQSHAQQFQVESFKKVSDNASSVQEVMKDINDTPCALLRVKTEEANVKITGNVIGNVMTNGTEYLVNVAAGTKKVTVVKKGFYPLTVLCSDYDFNSMKSNALYELTLKKVNVSNEVSGEIYGHEYVDLGLSVKWATCNIGATKIEDVGSSFRYGETQEYDEERPYIFGLEPPDILQPSNDVAHVKWGHSWRMPTEAEYKELEKKCKKVWTSRNGMVGMMYIASNGNTLFFPSTTAGRDYDYDDIVEYWLSNGNIMDAKDDNHLIQRPTFYESGYAVRAVSAEPQEKESWQEDYSMKADGFHSSHYYVDLGLSVKWATMNVGARSESEMGEDYGSDTSDRGDDAATVKWGGNWRTPSVSEIKELISKCEWKWTYNYKNKGIPGYIVTSKVEGYTDKCIFIPVDAINKGAFYISNEREKYWDENDSEWRMGSCLKLLANQFEVKFNGEVYGVDYFSLIRPVFK